MPAALMPRVECRPAPTLHLPRGLPGCGKSTLARGLASGGAVHVELDVFRRRLWPECPAIYDPYAGDGWRVHVAWEAEVLQHLAAGRDVVADRTNLDGRAAARLRYLAPGARFVVHDLTGVPLDVCIARDAGRPVGERVGEAGIRALWMRWLAGRGPVLGVTACVTGLVLPGSPVGAADTPSQAHGGPQGASGALGVPELVPSPPVAPEGPSGLSVSARDSLNPTNGVSKGKSNPRSRSRT